MTKTADDHGRIVMAAIIPDRRDLLDVALSHIVPQHFTDPILRTIFAVMERFAEQTGGILRRDALEQILYAKKDPGTLALYLETFDALTDQYVDDVDFRWSLRQIRELAAERETRAALTEGMEILTRGGTDDAGNEVRGHLESRTHILTRFAEIDRELSMQDAPEGDMTKEYEEMMEDYAKRKELHISGRNRGIMVGVPSLDAKIGGLQPGELDLIVGYSSSGKTTFACGQLAWSAAIEQGKNVVIATTETLRPQVRRKILSRHSTLPQFGLAKGLNNRDIKNGTLTEDEENALREVARDLTHNPNYGRLYIAQVPRGATISTLEARLYRIQRQFPIDLCVIDYLALLRADARRSSDREELNGIIKNAKQLATTFDDGRGVPVISPWQVNRASRDAARAAGYYTTMALAESAEATNSADVIVSLLEPEENNDRYADLRFQILKNRDGETSGLIEVQCDYGTGEFTERTAQSLMDFSGGQGDALYNSLLEM